MVWEQLRSRVRLQFVLKIVINENFWTVISKSLKALIYFRTYIIHSQVPTYSFSAVLIHFQFPASSLPTLPPSSDSHHVPQETEPHFVPSKFTPLRNLDNFMTFY